MCARLFFGYLFSLFSPIILKISNFTVFNDFLIFWGGVKLTSLAWLLMCWISGDEFEIYFIAQTYHIFEDVYFHCPL